MKKNLREGTYRSTAFLLSIMIALSTLFVYPVGTVEAALKPKLDKRAGSLVIGDTQKLKVKNIPKNVRLSYRSDKTTVATISPKGQIKARKAGKAKITVMVGKRKKALVYHLTVKKPSFASKKVSITIGETVLLNVKNNPKKAKYIWSSSDTEIATIKNGKVTGKKTGTAVVTVKLMTGKNVSYTLSTKVIVNAAKSTTDPTISENSNSYATPQTTQGDNSGKQYCNIAILASYGGSIDATSGKYACGEPISLTATANPKWKFVAWKSTDGGTFSNKDSQVTDFTPEKDTSLIAIFKEEAQVEITKEQSAVENAYHALRIQYKAGDYENSVTQNVNLISQYGEGEAKVDIQWSSSNEKIITPKGEVIRPSTEDVKITLKAQISKAASVKEKQFDLLVKKENSLETDTIPEKNTLNITEMNKDAEHQVEIEYNEEGDKVESIDGTFSDVLIDSSETALNAICSVKTLIGLENPEEELDPQAQNHDDTTVSYTFSQKYKDIPVYGTSVTVVADIKNGETRSLHSSVICTEMLEDLDLSPKLSKEEISRTFTDAVSCKLAIYGIKDYEDTPILVYITRTETETIIADADTGKVVFRFRNQFESGDYTTTGSGKDENDTEVTFPVQFHQRDLYFYYQEDMERQIFIKGDNSSIITHEFNTDWSDKTANSAYVNTIKVYDWYKEHLNRISIDNNHMPIIVNVHVPRTWSWSDWEWKGSNAYWDGSSISFLDNDSNADPLPTTANGLDIIAHEMTHGVLEKILKQEEGEDFILPYADETGAINEGYADVFGYLVDNDDWTIGEDWKQGGIRSLSHPEDFKDPITLDDPNLFKITADPDKDADAYSNQQSGLVHTNSSLVYHTAYLMRTYGITEANLEKLWYSSMSKGYDATSDYYTVRRNLIKAAKDNSLSDQDIANVRKAFDEEKIYAETGKIKINFLDTEGNQLNIQPQKEIQYSFTRNRKDVPTNVYTNSQYGGDSIQENQIYFGEYKTEISIPGYVKFNGNITIETNKQTEISITLVKDGTGKVGGTITSATTGKSLSDVDLKVRSGWNSKLGSVLIQGRSNEDGFYEFELQAGYYTLEMTKEKYATGYLNFYVEGGMEDWQENASISLGITLENTIRVVLTWGKDPNDLDSHLIGSFEGQERYHIYFDEDNAFDHEDNLIANLDVDDTTSYGPETTTFTVDTNGSYEYYIDWYEGSGTWATSEAKVEVYTGNSNEPVYVFEVPNWDYMEGQWNVFTYQNGIFTRSY